LDLLHRDLSRTRVAVVSIIPRSTGAAIASTEVMSELRGKLPKPRWKGIWMPSLNTPIVSFDMIANSHPAVFNMLLTMVLDDNFVKVPAWYDNECGYSNRLVAIVKAMSIRF
jgi:glyceraldehyde-3-phosphate dehydrogenase/erythrose-4-phosphate dehydrogenase